MKFRIILAILAIFLVLELDGQITPNIVDSLGLKQGMWCEFKVPTDLATEEIAIKMPDITTEYYYLTKDKDRKYFPIIECIGEYENGLKIGDWKEFYSNGKMKSSIHYKEGVPSGECKEYWGNGVLKAEYTINLNDSILVTAYEKSGDLMLKKVVPKTRIIKAIYEN